VDVEKGNSEMDQPQNSLETPDSDIEEDPTNVLNQWLGELNTLKKGLDKNSGNPASSKSSTTKPLLEEHPKNLQKEQKQQYRCSLINLDNSHDEELDAILGELSVLESQFDQEIKGADEKRGNVNSPGDSAVISPASDRSGSQELDIQNAKNLRSSSGSDENIIKDITGQSNKTQSTGQPSLKHFNGRTDSPDTDSAFCDNLSLLSSCSTASSSKTGQSLETTPNNVSHTFVLSKEEQEAKIKAEKIKIAIEKIKEASVKKLFIKVFSCNGSAKSLLVDEKMTVGHVTRILAEKNHMSLDPKWALVELIPDLYMERVYEDNELLVENCLLWKVDSKNTLWFIERPEKFDVFLRPEIYLLGSTNSQKDGPMEEHCRQELTEEYFSSSGVGAPQVEGQMWLKSENKKTWKKYHFILRSSGLYYAPKGKKSSKDLVCLTTFDVNQVYYGVGWHRKYKSPTEYCFGIKHPQIQAKNPKYIKYLCVDTQKELHQWVTGIRIAKNGRCLFDNYRGIVEEITHADIDILTSKRFSVNSSNDLKVVPGSVNAAKNLGQSCVDEHLNGSQLLTPSSENKSLASGLSSGIESDLSLESNNMSETKFCEKAVTNKSVKDSRISNALDLESTYTPSSTLQREFKLRRSFSRSSSSSGCMSDKSGDVDKGTLQHELGFESDFPVGGTIKKRPMVTAKLPLTSTTWGLVKESEQDILDSSIDTQDSSVLSDNTSLKGTLLRKAVKNSLKEKHKSDPETTKDKTEFTESKSTLDPMSSVYERNVSSLSEQDEIIPLPPPPRVDSVTSLESIDLLPPPPPEILYPLHHDTESNHYHVSPVTSPIANEPKGLPPTKPSSTKSSMSSGQRPGQLQKSSQSTLKKSGAIQKPSRRISFDDNVQMIEVSPNSPTKNQQQIINVRANDVTKYSPPMPIRNENPNKLMFIEEETPNDNYGSLPRSFINSLQKVMNKKWQVAEKCRVAGPGDKNTPHEVLGFRDEHLNSHATGEPNLYSKNSAIGAWVLETQRYANEPPYCEENNHHENNQTFAEQHLMHQPIKNMHGDHVSQSQQQSQFNHLSPYDHHKINNFNKSYTNIPAENYQFPQNQQQYQVYNAQQKGQCVHVEEIPSHQIYAQGHGQFYNHTNGHFHQAQMPVVLREPDPIYADPSRMRAMKSPGRGKEMPPPPPKRSLSTQLTNNHT